jgi:ABC-type uncharacterized transport system permease subunit
LQRVYDYDVVSPLSALCVIAGAAISLSFVKDWVKDGFKVFHLSHGFIAGLGLAMIGFQLFLRTLTVTLFSFGSSPEELPKS